MLGLFTEEKKKVKARQNQKPSLNHVLKGILNINTLDGWKDDKEKFKIDLVNDIKDFLFTKWEKPWRASLVFDESGKVLSGYRNINGRIYKNLVNILSLERNSNRNPFFITLSKLKGLGGSILDKDKIVSIVSYIPMWKDKENKTPRPPDFVLPKYHMAINIEFVKGVESPKFEIEQFEKLELNEYVENFIKELKKRKRIPALIYDQADSCHYKYAMGTYKPESIHLVKINTFKNIEAYYSTLFHEIIHSTKNPARLGRGKLAQKLDYANEELVAELGAMIICEELGLKYNRQNSLVYLKSWLKNTENVDTALLEAYSYASDAAEYLLKNIDLNKLVPPSMVKRVKAEKPELNGQKKTLSTNEKFNQELTLLIDGKLSKKHIFELGTPSNKLLKGGIENKTIELAAIRLKNKSNQDEHPFDLSCLYNLPQSLRNPIAVFDSTKGENSKVILTELKDGKSNFVVIIRVFKGANNVEINSVKSLYPKSNIVGVFDWIIEGLMRWVDKKKAFSFVSAQSTNLIADKNKSKSLYATNIIRNFGNKKQTVQGLHDLPNTKNTIALDKWEPSSHIKLLKGQLGKFIGGYERKQFAVVLRGEKGAGKTRLLCQMIDLFALEKLNGLFLSLEVSPESELFGNYISYISDKAKKHVAVSNSNTIEELEEYAKKYDFIAIDSWGKLKDVSQDDFIRLIEKYPNVLWLCIFQSTTNGTARGGIMSEYDSSIVIQVAKGGDAQCEKNRYNSCDKVYNVFTKKLIENEN